MAESRFQRRLHFALNALIFVALPLLLITVACNRFWDRAERSALEQVRQRLERVLLLLRRREEPERYLAELLSALQGRSWAAAATEPREKILQRGLSDLRRRFPGMLSVVVVDANGEVVDALTDGVISRAVARRLFFTLLREKRGELKPEEARAAWPVLQSFVGPHAVMTDIISSRPSLRLAHHGDRRTFFFPAVDEGGALFVHVNRTSDWRLLPLRDQLRRFRLLRRSSGLEAGLIQSAAPAAGSKRLQSAFDAFEINLQTHQRSDGTWYAFHRLPDGSALWASLPDRISERFRLRRLRLALLVIIGFALYLIVASRLTFGPDPLTLSIRRRLILLFGFCAGLPLCVLWITGWDYLDHLERVRTRETYDEVERQLWAFDARFRQMRHHLERRLAKAMERCSFRTPVECEASFEIIRTLSAEFDTTDVMLFDHRGKLQWRYPERFHLQKEAASKLLGEVTGRLCSILNGDEEGGKNVASGLLLDTLQEFGGGLDIIKQLASTLGTITEFSSGVEKAWVFLARFNDRPGHIGHMVMFNWRKTDLEKYYLERSILSAEREWQGLRLLAYNAQGPVRSFTPSFHPFIQPALPVMLEQRQRDASVFRPIAVASRTWLACAMKPRELGDYYLCGARSAEPIADEVNLWKRFYLLFTVMLAALAWVLGNMLARRFLTPVRDLSLAVQAIDQRDFQHRLPMYHADELGRLAMTFNRVMEGLSDLEVARIVQENLFPKDEISVGEYRLFGRSFPATELGGDYLDLRILPEDRVLIVIGDVSGHGVPAALVMALAKGAADVQCEKNADPSEILGAMNRALVGSVRRKRLMSCFLAVLDTRRHELCFCNAGHCDPILIRADGTVEFIVNRSHMLGIRAQAVYATTTLAVNPGDRIVFYSDGLVETRTENGQIGFPAVQQAVPTLFDADLPTSCRRMYQWAKEQNIASCQEDDITILLFARSPSS